MLGTFLGRTQETHAEVNEGQLYRHTSSSTKTIATFFSPITPTHATSQARATQMGSPPGHYKGVTIDWEITISVHWPPLNGQQSHHPCHQ